MQGAILNGLYNLSVPVKFTCPTGQCQWNEYSTLAVTSSCADVTSATNVSCNQTGRKVVCSYTTPNNLLIKASAFHGSGPDYFTYFNTSARISEPYLGGVLNNSIINFAMARMESGSLDNLTRPEVTECDMRWCARTVQGVNVTNGMFNSGIAKDIELFGVENPFWGRNMWISYNVSDDQLAFRGNRTFNISPVDQMEIKKFLQKIFSSTIQDPFGLALINSTSLTETVARISTSITYALGQGPSGTKLEGQTTENEQYIHVNWSWISLSIVTVVMGITVLLCTLLQTRRRRVLAWKSSALVPMITVMDGWDIKGLRTASWRKLEERSKHMRGVLVHGESNVQYFKRTNTP